MRVYETPTYSSWRHMLYRCKSKKCDKYSRYGGRGVRVCDRWLEYQNFLDDMGERPEGKTLDRIDNDGNYEPGNCRWATCKEQADNRSSAIIVDMAGKRMRVSDLAKEYGIDINTLRYRLHRMPPEEAVTKPLMFKRSDYARNI